MVWASGLPTFGRAPLERAAWAAMRAWLDVFSVSCMLRLPDYYRDPVRAELGSVAAALERCALAPCDETRRAAGRAAHTLSRWPDHMDLRTARAQLRALVQALSARLPTLQATECAVQAIVHADIPPISASRSAAVRAGVGDGRIRNVIRSALVPWLLSPARDSGDPPQESAR